mgnify:CR=1 FL=1
MAVYRIIDEHFQKYLPSKESILATIRGEPILSSETYRCCITDQRLAILEKSGLFSWRYQALPFDLVKAIWIDDGVFKSTVVLIMKKGDDLRFSDVSKTDAREFVAAFTACSENDHEVMSQRTKVCPECDELVKCRARRCKHCGYRFS